MIGNRFHPETVRLEDVAVPKIPAEIACVCVYVRSDGYSSEEVLLKWIEPRDKAVEFDPTGENMPQFVMDDFDLTECTYNKTKRQ